MITYTKKWNEKKWKKMNRGLLSEQDGAMRDKMCIFPNNMCIFLYVVHTKKKIKRSTYEKKNKQGATQWARRRCWGCLRYKRIHSIREHILSIREHLLSIREYILSIREYTLSIREYLLYENTFYTRTHSIYKRIHSIYKRIPSIREHIL